MQHAGVVSRVDGAREVVEQRHGALGGGGRVVAHRDVQGLGGHILLGQVGNALLAAHRERRDDARMGHPGVDEPVQGRGEILRDLRRQIELEGLDRDGAAGLRRHGAVHRTEDTGPELMQDPERAERTGSGRRRGVVECQWSSPPGPAGGSYHGSGVVSTGWPDPGEAARPLTAQSPVCESRLSVPADVPSSTPPSPSVAIDLRRLPWAGRLVRDYNHAFERLSSFYAGSPAVPEAWAEVIERRRRHPPLAATAEVLSAQLAARGAPAAAQEAARRLARPGAVAVVTGQQAGLFGGPLYTLLKALTGIRLAERLAREHGATVVPVFWVDAEDHDLDEIRHCPLLDADLDPRAVGIDLDSPRGTAAAAIRLAGNVRDATASLRDLLPSTEFTAELIAGLDAAYAEGRRMVEAFARWLDQLAGSAGLVVFDASDPAAKPLVRSLFADELRAAGETARQAAAAGAALVAAGYHAQVEPQPDGVALFRLGETRQPIRVARGGFTVGGQTVRADDLLREVDARPARFSPNVLLRPIVQDALFPTVAYVSGPNELAYLGQLREVYARFGVPMPIIYPRASATIVDPATVKFLERYDLELADLQPRDDAVLNRLLAAQIPAELEAALAAADAAVDERLAALATSATLLDPTLSGVVESTRRRMHRDLATLRGKVVQAAKRRDETLRRQFRRARAQAAPGGEPQERSVGTIYFLNRYGPAFVDRLLADLPLDPGRHWLLTV